MPAWWKSVWRLNVIGLWSKYELTNPKSVQHQTYLGFPARQANELEDNTFKFSKLTTRAIQKATNGKLGKKTSKGLLENKDFHGGKNKRLENY